MKITTVRTIVLKIFIILMNEINSQMIPMSQCPKIFQYQFDGIKWFGRVKVDNPPVDEPLHLKVTLSVRGKPLTNFLGEIELLTRGKPVNKNYSVFYNVKFPITSIPPKLINVIVNNYTICYGQPELGLFLTLINLEHTRVFTFLPNTRLSVPNQTFDEDQPKNAFISNISKGNQQTFPTQETCGKVNEKAFVLKNENDNKLARGSWPWLTAIYVNNFTSLTYICGGSLLSKSIIVTAAHCFHIYQKKYNANDVIVFLGRHNLQNWNEDGAIVSPVDKIFIHPDYDNNLSSFDADIAVLILKGRVTFNDYITPICLWNESDKIEYIDGNSGFVVGWGFDENNFLSTIPKKLKVQIVMNSACIQADKKYGSIISTRTFCAGGELPCVGYSGGGLMLLKNDKWYLRGIVSSSLPGSCKSNKYVIYTDFSKFLDWIYAFMI